MMIPELRANKGRWHLPPKSLPRIYLVSGICAFYIRVVAFSAERKVKIIKK